MVYCLQYLGCVEEAYYCGRVVLAIEPSIVRNDGHRTIDKAFDVIGRLRLTPIHSLDSNLVWLGYATDTLDTAANRIPTQRIRPGSRRLTVAFPRRRLARIWISVGLTSVVAHLFA